MNQTNLDPTTATRVLDLDVANLIAKSKSGKPLSKHERQLIAMHTQPKTFPAAAGGTPTKFAKSKSALAKALAIARNTLETYLALPDAPKETPAGWPVQAVKDFILQNSRDTALAAKMDADLGTLKRWHVYEQARAQKMRNDERENILAPVKELKAQLADFVSTIQNEFDRLPRIMATELSGLGPVEIEQHLTSRISAIWKCHAKKP